MDSHLERETGPRALSSTQPSAGLQRSAPPRRHERYDVCNRPKRRLSYGLPLRKLCCIELIAVSSILVFSNGRAALVLRVRDLSAPLRMQLALFYSQRNEHLIQGLFFRQLQADVWRRKIQTSRKQPMLANTHCSSTIAYELAQTLEVRGANRCVLAIAPQFQKLKHP